MKKKMKIAFTMAETLMSMVIIGIISIVLIPLINHSATIPKYQAQFADAVRDTNNLFMSYTKSKRCNGSLSCTGLFSYSNKDSDIRDELTNILNIKLKTANCWSVNTATKLNGTDKVNLNTEGACWIDAKNRIFSVINISTKEHQNCSVDLRANDTKNTKLINSCSYLIIDIDGDKGANTFGKDVYAFIITDSPGNYLYPVGGKLATESYKNLKYWNGTTKTCQGNDEGRTCAARIIDNNWKIDYLK